MNKTYHDGRAEIIIIAALSARTIQIRNSTFYVERMNLEKNTEEQELYILAFESNFDLKAELLNKIKDKVSILICQEIP